MPSANYLTYCFRRLEREEGARRLAQEKVETLQETAKTCANEVAHLRKRRRELESKNAELRYDAQRQRRVSRGFCCQYLFCFVGGGFVRGGVLAVVCGPCRTLVSYPLDLSFIHP